jgi:two-component system sensor histidine kinase EvgS
VDQILDIARIAAGRLEVSREVITLRPYVLNIASELESLFAERSLRHSITVPATLPRVRTDPTHLRHILVNLLGNAVKYTPQGNVAVRARLLGGATQIVRKTPDDPTLLAAAPDRNGAWIALQVADTGIGIPVKDRERIFDEFEQVNAGPRTDSVARGTGLGLAISRRLAQALGGDITVESEQGKGSTFTMWLPVELVDLQAASIVAKPDLAGPRGVPTSEKST